MISDTYYFRSHESGYGEVLIVTQNHWDDELTDLVHEKRIKCVRLSYGVSWKGDGIEFVRELPPLVCFECGAWKVNDFSALDTQSTLCRISIEDRVSKPPDFSGFKKLEAFSCNWSPKLEEILICQSIKHLQIWKYPFTDLQPLQKMKQLKHLQIQSRKLENTDGIEDLSDLRKLDLALCTQLQDISATARCKSLEEVKFYSNNKLHDISPLAMLPNLRKLDVENIDKIDSIKCFAGSESLEFAYFAGVNIEDGDTSPLLTMPNLKRTALATKRHYNVHRDEIYAHLGM